MSSISRPIPEPPPADLTAAMHAGLSADLAEAPDEAAPTLMADFAQLAKARLTAMVLLTTAVGFLLAEHGPIRWGLLAVTVVGTGLAAASAMVLNQLIETERDGRMVRTRGRPLPAGRVRRGAAMALAGVMGFAGVAMLNELVHPLAALLAGGNILLYAFVYTPLKTRTTFNTIVGAVSGAVPPIIGWVASAGELQPGAWLLGALLFLWQIPHFLALAWLYRDDYRRGGFVMLPLVDHDGLVTSRVVLISSLCLVPLGLAAVLVGLAGTPYAVGALLLGTGMAILAGRLWRVRSDRNARAVFVGSLVYLPLLLMLMAVDHDWTRAERQQHGAVAALRQQR